MRVLVACEYSGTVRDEFIKLGHDAMSCDLLPTDVLGPHYTGDVFDIINDRWDLMIAFPPCTHLALSGAPHFEKKRQDGRQQEALEFVKALMLAPIDKIAIENPLGIISSNIRPHDQVIQPYEFGDPFQKSTCLWLKNLPLLKPTKIVKPELYTYKNGRTDGMWHIKTMKLKPEARMKARSKTFQGIANAMAEQWG
jgi:site-specific DNA-cytosine methylase